MPASVEPLSHWHYSVENLSTSTMGFYESVELALKAKKIDSVRLVRLSWRERGLLSGTREYLRVEYSRYVFDVGAFPMGTDYFFSWWLSKRLPNFAALTGCLTLVGAPIALILCLAILGIAKGVLAFALLAGLVAGFLGLSGNPNDSNFEDAVLAAPLVGPLYQRLFRPVTYYGEDTRKMFEETVSRVVQDVLAGVLTINKMTPLTEAQKQAQRAEK